MRQTLIFSLNDLWNRCCGTRLFLWQLKHIYSPWFVCVFVSISTHIVCLFVLEYSTTGCTHMQCRENTCARTVCGLCLRVSDMTTCSDWWGFVWLPMAGRKQPEPTGRHLSSPLLPLEGKDANKCISTLKIITEQTNLWMFEPWVRSTYVWKQRVALKIGASPQCWWKN